ncbi:MAG: hypothetical protein ACHQQQ_15265 [Bacteroidota bacterium]
MRIFSISIFSSLLFLSIIVAWCSANANGKNDSIENSFTSYRIANVVRLTVSQNGIDGELQLLLDKHLPKDIRDWNPLDDTIRHQPAILRILDSKGTLILIDSLERAVASFDSSNVIPDTPSWSSLMVNYSVGAGSYAGPVTSFIRVKKSKLEWLESINKSTGNSDTIKLTLSLKNNWRLIKTANRDTFNILSVKCSPHSIPTSGDVDFEIIYGRYYPETGKWFYVERKEKGFLEFTADSGFPDESKFPTSSWRNTSYEGDGDNTKAISASNSADNSINKPEVKLSVDSAMIFSYYAREDGNRGDFISALSLSESALRFALLRYKRAGYTKSAQILDSCSFIDLTYIARYFATIYYCTECREPNDSIVPKLRFVLKTIYKKAPSYLPSNQWYYLFVTTYRNEYRSYEDASTMFFGALQVDRSAFVNLFEMAAKNVGVVISPNRFPSIPYHR